MSARSSLTIVLAAGEGTRMRSSAGEGAASRGRPVAAGACAGRRSEGRRRRAGGGGRARPRAVGEEAKRIRPDAAIFVQRERLGTAHAVLAARDAIAVGADDLLVVFGDTPLISAETFSRLRAPLQSGAALAVLGFRAADPTGYGRLLVEDGRLVASASTPTRRLTQRADHALQCRRDGVRRPPRAAKSSTPSAMPTARASII